MVGSVVALVARDRHDLHRPGLGQVFATLPNFALSILRILQPPGDSLIETAENIRDSPRKTPPNSRIERILKLAVLLGRDKDKGSEHHGKGKIG